MKRSGGFTLMEILVVMAVISVLMGFGIGLYRSMATLGKAAQARNTLIETVQVVKVSSRTWPAALVVDPPGNRVYGLEFRTVLSSNFEPSAEDQVIGLGPKNGNLIGDAQVEAFPMGRTGGGLVCDLGGVNFGNYADYDLIDGVSLDVSVLPTENRSMYLVRKGKSYGIRLEEGPGGPVVVAYLALGTAEDVRKGRTGQALLFRVANRPLILNRWNRILLSYERTRVEISIDSWDRGPLPCLVEEEKEQRYILPDRDADLIIGDDGRRGVRGTVDDLKVAGIFAGEARPFPEEVTVAWFDAEAAKEKQEVRDRVLRVRFDDGKLDPDFHQADVEIRLFYKADMTPIRIGLLGNVLLK